MLRLHGNLIRFVSAIADQYGWKAEAENIDIMQGDLYDTRRPGCGDIVLVAPDGAKTTFEYGLPESEKDIQETVFQVIEGKELDDKHRKRDKRQPLRKRV